MGGKSTVMFLYEFAKVRLCIKITVTLLSKKGQSIFIWIFLFCLKNLQAVCAYFS